MTTEVSDLTQGGAGGRGISFVPGPDCARRDCAAICVQCILAEEPGVIGHGLCRPGWGIGHSTALESKGKQEGEHLT